MNTKKIAQDLIDQETIIFLQSQMIDDPFYNLRDTFKPIRDVMFIPDEFCHNISKNPIWDEDFFYLSFRYDPRSRAEIEAKTIFDLFDEIIPWDDMRIKKVSETLKTTHFKCIISKN